MQRAATLKNLKLPAFPGARRGEHLPDLLEIVGKINALLRFLTQKGIAVIPRSTQPQHIRENIALFDFALTETEIAQLSALDKKEPFIGRPETPELVELSLTW